MEVEVFTFLTDPTDDMFQKGIDCLQEFAKKYPNIQITGMAQSSTPFSGRVATTLTIFYKKTVRS